jgi:hypothetical protein
VSEFVTLNQLAEKGRHYLLFVSSGLQKVLAAISLRILAVVKETGQNLDFWVGHKYKWCKGEERALPRVAAKGYGCMPRPGAKVIYRNPTTNSALNNAETLTA